MFRPTFCLLAALAPVIAPGPTRAQAVVSPGHFAVAEGNLTAAPIGVVTAVAAGTRFLQVCGGLPGPIVIHQIAFRPSARVQQPTVAISAMVRIWMSDAATTPTSLAANLDANHGANKTLVFASPAGQSVTLQPPVTMGPVPRDFSYAIQLQTPFQYSGKAPLCLEIESIPTVAVQPKIWFDGFDHPDPDPDPYRGLRGTGCVASGQSSPMTMAPFAVFNAWTFWASGSVSFSLNCIRAPSLAAGVFLFGIDDIGFPIPGTASGSSGACSLYTTPLLSVPTTFGATGMARLGFNAALFPALHGKTFCFQAAAFDKNANSTGVVTSEAAVLHLTAPFGALPVGAVTGYVGIANGAVQADKGVIIEFR